MITNNLIFKNLIIELCIMKRLFFYLLFAMAMTLCYADGTYYNVSIGDFKYDLNYRTSGESTATLNGLADPSYSGYMYIPGYVDYSGKKYRVDKILNYAFKGNTKITRAYIDYGVTTIQTAAFENCTALNQVTMPSSISTIAWDVFQNCTSLKRVAYAGEVPPKIYATTFNTGSTNMWCYTATQRGANALDNNNLWSIAFGDNIERNNTYAYDFKNQGIAYVIKNGIPYQGTNSQCIMVGGNSTNNGIVTLDQHVNPSTMVNPPGNYRLIAVADSAFLGNTSVTAVTNYYCMADKIGLAAFAKCTNLKSAYLAVDSIMMNAFSGCSNLSTLKLYKANEDGPNAVVYIGSYAFEKTALTTANIPESVKFIGNAPFFSCPNLTTITVDSNNEYYSAYNGCLYNYNYMYLIQVPAAWNCGNYGPQNTGFATSLRYIQSYAVEGNKTIVNLYLPYGVEQIGLRSFASCTNLRSVRIPSSVTTLNKTAFSNSNNINTVYLNLVTPPSVINVFGESPESIKLYVPRDAYSAYSSATYWKWFQLQTGNLDHTNVWDHMDSNGYTWTVIDKASHTNYAGYSRDGNARLVRGKTSTSIPTAVIINGKYYDPVEIGRSAFEGLTGTVNVSGGSFVKHIFPRAFYGTSLNNFTFTRVEEIRDSAFTNTSSLSASLSLDYLKKVGIRSFYNSAIKNFSCGSSLSSMGLSAFAQCKSLTTVNINAKATLTTIPENAFYNCSALTTMKFPAGLKTLKKFALYNTSLTDIELPYGFTTAEEEALTCKATRIVFPATTTSIHYKYDQFAYNNLLELVVNRKTPPTINGNATQSFYTSSLPRVTGALYVPVGYVGSYTAAWSQFGVSADHAVKEGGYDFTNTSDGLKYTVTTAASGSSSGTCEMVYNPKVLNSKTSIIAGDGKQDQYGRTYNCTSIGESCFLGSTSLKTVYFTPTLKTISAFAFMNSSLSSCQQSSGSNPSTGFIPTTVSYIGQYAFSGCKSLHELFLPHIDRKNSITVGQAFFDNNASDFKLWVDYRRLGDFINTNYFNGSRVYPHLQLDSEWQTFSCVKDVDFNNTLVEAYVAASYSKSDNSVALNNVLRLPAGTGAVVHGQPNSTFYRLYYPSSTPAVASIMESVTSGSTTVSSNNALSYFKLNSQTPTFSKITSSTAFYRGYAYLKLNTSTVGSNTTQVWSNLSGMGGDSTPGDVNGDGEVTGSDVTALYNYLLFNNSSAIVNGDQNGDGAITGSDVTAVYNILLGLN